MNRLKAILKYEEHFKEKLSNSKCLITISAGQEVHEGEKFIATVSLVNSSFSSCILLVDDSLQRHTMALSSKYEADFFYSESLNLGDEWLKRNEKYWRNLNNLEKILRWDYWLKHPKYELIKKILLETVAADFSYKEAFDITITEFLTRYFKRTTDTYSNEKRAYLLCFDYLMEECIAMCLWPELNCQFEVYPNKRNLAMSETHKRFVLEKHPDLLHPVSIKFKNRKQFRHQNFNK